MVWKVLQIYASKRVKGTDPGVEPERPRLMSDRSTKAGMRDGDTFGGSSTTGCEHDI